MPPWVLDKGLFSISESRFCRMVLAEVCPEEVEENLVLHAERLPALEAHDLIEHYRRLIKLTVPEVIGRPERTLVQSSRHLIRDETDVPVLLSPLPSRPYCLLTHNPKHFTPPFARHT